jgi:hypothetical protein
MMFGGWTGVAVLVEVVVSMTIGCCMLDRARRAFSVTNLHTGFCDYVLAERE